MRIKCVFGHTKRVVLACCEHVITFVPEITWRVTFMHPLVDIATDLSYRWKYWPKHSRYVLVDMIYWATCWPTHWPTMSQYFASMAVNTRSVWWPLNVSGISVNCWWYIDQLSYNTMCFRSFLKRLASWKCLVQVTGSVMDLMIRQRWCPWKGCQKIDFTSFLSFWEPLKKPVKCGL